MAVTFLNGQIADTPTLEADLVRVSVPDLNYLGRNVYGPLAWRPKVLGSGGIVYPQKGDNCLIAIDDSALGAQWIVSWSGTRAPIFPPAPAIPSTLTGVQVRDVGDPGQIRAGRILTVADFTNMGLSAPLGLWNLGDLLDVSGNGRNLTNKNGATFGSGITGAVTEAALFDGTISNKALYIPGDGGAADLALRIKTGSWGCWFRTAKRGTAVYLMAKLPNPYVQASSWFDLSINLNVAQATFYATSFATTAAGLSDICDDRWHFAVGTYDGTVGRLYVDAALEGQKYPAGGGPLGGAAAPFNIGGAGADSTTAVMSPHWGRVAVAFITSDVLNDDQVRNLYLVSIPHTLGSIPKTVRMRVARRKRGGPYVVGDFPTTPARFYNFTAGALTNDGSDANGAAGTTATLSINPGAGTIVSVVGPDGVAGGAYQFGGTHQGLLATDTGLPSGTNARTIGCWYKTTTGATSQAMIRYGSSPYICLYMLNGGLGITDNVTSFIADFISSADGLWHFGVCVIDPAAVDGQKIKLYKDGRLIGTSTSTIGGTVLGGASTLNIGLLGGTTWDWNGTLARPFIISDPLSDIQIRALYNKGSQALTSSPKYEGDHIEALEATRLLATFDTIEATDLISMEVLA